MAYRKFGGYPEAGLSFDLLDVTLESLGKERRDWPDSLIHLFRSETVKMGQRSLPGLGSPCKEGSWSQRQSTPEVGRLFAA
jgi:hypothetical protein